LGRDAREPQDKKSLPSPYARPSDTSVAIWPNKFGTVGVTHA
jgi:hypothetical protein